MLPLAVHGILTQAITGNPPPRVGNAAVGASPHGVYPCAGHDEWLLIQVDSEAAWAALKRLAGLDYGELADRLTRRAALDGDLSAWTRTQHAGDLMVALQGQGICAARVQAAADLLADPHLAARGFWQTLERVHVGPQPNPSAPYQVGGAPIPIEAPAPTLGQDNDLILKGRLGLTDSAMARLYDRGVIGDRPRMPSRSA
jgi:crotonobetainyl-CoA:carnitine CoA-transferase CaiB-like acyl-CoA transferase